MYLDKSSGPFTDINLRPHCLAAAAARRVFPVPGGPYRRRPDWRRKGALENMLGYYKRKIIKLINYYFNFEKTMQVI